MDSVSTTKSLAENDSPPSYETAVMLFKDGVQNNAKPAVIISQPGQQLPVQQSVIIISTTTGNPENMCKRCQNESFFTIQTTSIWQHFWGLMICCFSGLM